MNTVRLLPVILSLILLAAHYYRAGMLPMAVVILGSGLTLLVRQKWSVRIIQTELRIGAIEWVVAGYRLVMVRQDMHMHWMRLAVILSVVAFFTVCSVFVFRFRPLRDRYGL